jgi:hypothetical protein
MLFQEAVSHRDFTKIVSLSANNPSLLYEALAFGPCSIAEIKPLEEFTPSEIRKSLCLTEHQAEEVIEFIGKLKEKYFEGFTISEECHI